MLLLYLGALSDDARLTSVCRVPVGPIFMVIYLFIYMLANICANHFLGDPSKWSRDITECEIDDDDVISLKLYHILAHCGSHLILQRAPVCLVRPLS